MKAHEKYEFLIDENEGLLPTPVGSLQIEQFPNDNSTQNDYPVWFSLIIPIYN